MQHDYILVVEILLECGDRTKSEMEIIMLEKLKKFLFFRFVLPYEKLGKKNLYWRIVCKNALKSYYDEKKFSRQAGYILQDQGNLVEYSLQEEEEITDATKVVISCGSINRAWEFLSSWGFYKVKLNNRVYDTREPYSID